MAKKIIAWRQFVENALLVKSQENDTVHGLLSVLSRRKMDWLMNLGHLKESRREK